MWCKGKAFPRPFQGDEILNLSTFTTLSDLSNPNHVPNTYIQNVGGGLQKLTLELEELYFEGQAQSDFWTLELVGQLWTGRLIGDMFVALNKHIELVRTLVRFRWDWYPSTKSIAFKQIWIAKETVMCDMCDSSSVIVKVCCEEAGTTMMQRWEKKGPSQKFGYLAQWKKPILGGLRSYILLSLAGLLG